MSENTEPDLNTSHEFATAAEARAFELGFLMAGNDGIQCSVDDRKPYLITIEFVDTETGTRTEAHDHYQKVIAKCKR